MKTESIWMIPFNRYMDLYIWALTGNYIVIPIAIIGISNTFSYFNRILKLQRNNLSLELDFLRSQLNPHFLFNSLNNIYSMVEETNELAGNTILKLADLMRYSLYESSSENVLLSREILFLKDYIELEKIRHTPDTQINFQADGNFEDHRIPPFLLIPFVENAFKHGLNTVGKKWVEINIHLSNSKLVFQVKNSKPTAQSEQLQKGGIGLVNLKKRLDIYYPNRYELKINNSAAEYDVFLQITLK
ncbi:histidine kinase [Dyadobacter pollutisoli]|uniref:Histidine kinase n=2 Tax=Dyadobacter pollutisoli TaxID=2910158 RepID=A0A9E8NH60_9BACT|nr:histidine kinase [Dyadobacter pollutisoli]WAC14901.1 histidine kinase [Dyadobacter pollutisoli]